MTRIVIWLKLPDGSWKAGAVSEPFDMADVRGVQVEFQDNRVYQEKGPMYVGLAEPPGPFDGTFPLAPDRGVAGTKMPAPPGQGGGG